MFGRVGGSTRKMPWDGASGKLALWEWNRPKGTMHFNAGVAELLGEPAAFTSDVAAWEARIEPEDARQRRQLVEATFRGETSRWTCRCRFHTVDGQTVETIESGFVARQGDEVVSAVGVIRPAIAETAGASEESLLTRIEESERQFRTFVDFLPQLAWMTDATGWLEFYNRRWYEYTGTTFEQMEGWGWISVHDPNDLPRMVRIYRNAIQSGEPWEDEFRLRRGSDGMLRWHLSRAMPVRDANGRIVRWFGTNTDIHDQKLAAEEYSRLLLREKQARREAESANRAKDEFLAVVSHELRSPLNVILGWTQILTKRTPSSEKLQAGLAKIEANAKLQSTLIDDLLDVSRVVSGKLAVDLEPLPIGEVVLAVVDAARPAAEEKGIVLTLSERSDSAVVLGCRARLGQIATNLLTNAIKFTPAGGRIEVTVESRDKSVMIVVRDTGEGMSAELLRHVFERFRQGDASSTRKHGGLGLGLAIVRELVHLHKGEVFAESPGVGLGATVCVRLPVAANEQQPVSRTAPQPQEPVHLTGIKVLAVDDEVTAREMIAEILLACGATVTLASSVHDALRAFKVDPPDVVLSDVAMPELDGFALVERIRKLGHRTPIIALTAYASLQDQQRALQLGFDRHLAKPVDAVALSAVIAELARSSLLDLVNDGAT